MLDIFKTSKYDNFVFVDEYSVFDIKEFVAFNISKLKNLKENIVVLPENTLDFIITFFAGIFCQKKLYLMQDIQKLNSLDFEYDILKVEYKKQKFEYNEMDFKKPLVHFFTSGTTNGAKCISKSIYNLICEAKCLKKEVDFGKNLQFISSTTPCHLFGLTHQIMYPFVNIEDNLKIITQRINYPDKINFKNCVLVSTPAFLAAFKKYNITFENPPFYIVSAGSKLNDELFSYLSLSSKVLEIYGSTETGIIARKTNPKEDFCLFDEVKIEKQKDNFIVKSDFIFEENFKLQDDIELQNRKIKIKGRLDRLIKIQEKRIDPFEIENFLLQFDEIKDIYLIKSKEKLAALCALSNFGKQKVLKIGTVELIKHFKNKMFKYFEIVPQKWRFCDEIPKKETGKINNTIIEEMFSSNLSFPVILDKKINNNSVVYSLFFHKNCNFFKGHFEGFKIVAGVVQLYLASKFAYWHYNLQLGAGQIKRIKFTNVIKMSSVVDLKLELKENAVYFEYLKDDNICSSGILPLQNILENKK